MAGRAISLSNFPSTAKTLSVSCASVRQTVTKRLAMRLTDERTSRLLAWGMSVFQAAGSALPVSIATTR